MNDAHRPLVWLIPATLAAASAPSLLAFNVAPSATFLNNGLALTLWGLVVAAAGREVALSQRERELMLGACVVPLLPLALVCLAAVGAGLWGRLPTPLALSGVGTLLAAGVLTLAGCRCASADDPRAARIFAVFCLAWLVAGLLNVLIALVQVVAPQWADGSWIARSSFAGRAVGNLRQPNHVSTLLLWATIAALTLHEMKLVGRQMLGWTLALLTLALVLTASRTAIVGIGLLTLWGLLDRRLSRPGRAWLLGLPALYALAWLATAAWSRWNQSTFAAEARLGEADLSASRFRIWSDTWVLIQQHPLAGVGFGEFNLAWSLTPMPHRPPAFFDHSHNLLLQWAVELGVPAALLMVGLLCLVLVRLWQSGQRVDVSARDTLPARATLAFLLMMALHSQLEYPLWYAYFLLPTAWLVGFGWARARRADGLAPEPAASVRSLSSGMTMAGIALTLCSVAAIADYTRVAAIFDNSSNGPLAQRIAAGQRSLLFGHHGDYAAATVSQQPQLELEALARASHYLLDTRLMTAWADAWAASGDLSRAQHLAARLREFGNPNSVDYFAACPALAASVPSELAKPLPYQCVEETSPVRLLWTDFGAPR